MKTGDPIELDLKDATYGELARSARRISTLLKSGKAHENQDVLGSLDDFLGAVYALILARLLDFADRDDRPIEISAVTKRADQVAGGAVRTDGKWMAGFHFNSAVFRIAAVYHRALKVVTGSSKGSVDRLRGEARTLYRGWRHSDWSGTSLDRIHDQANNLKHDAKGTYERRRVQYHEAVEAVVELLDLLEAWRDAP